MLKFYLITAFRNLKKNRIISIVNIIGLAVGLTCSIFAIFYSVNELTYENCHEKADQLSKVYSYGKFGSIEKIPTTFPKVGDDLTDKFPEIINSSVSRNVEGIVFKETQPFNQANISFANRGFFDLFSIRLKDGRLPEAQQDILLSEQMARKYFGSEPPIGKSLDLDVWGNRYTYNITGVFEDLPDNTHLKVSCIIPLEMGRNFGWPIDNSDDGGFHVYVETLEGTDIRTLNNKIAAQYELPVAIEDFSTALIPLKRIHLHETLEENNFSNLLIILVGGIVALVLSCFSYLNLTTILFNLRRQEVGIKKVNGGGRSSIMWQFLMDTALTAAISLSLAGMVFYYLLPHFNTLMDRQLSLAPPPMVLIILLGTFLFTVLFSGLIPSWSLSRHRPVSLIRKSDTQLRSSGMKNTLLTTQFVIAVILLQFFIISQRQNNYMFEDNVNGYNTDNVFMISGYEWGDLNVVKDELLKSTAIDAVSWSNTVPGMGINMTNRWNKTENEEMAHLIEVAPDYLDVFQIRLNEGRFFDTDFQGDDKSVVINSLTANSIGYENPVGKTMLFRGEQYKIIGMVDNYLSVPVIFDEMPVIMSQSANRNQQLSIRIKEDQIEEARNYITSVLQERNPDFPVNLQFYLDVASEQGRSYMATGVITNALTWIIILNAMIGLFGLSFFIAQHRNKEVGIRKVCGASVKSVVWKLSRGFALKLILALCIATPISYFGGGEFIKMFSRHISMTPDLFILGGGLAFLMVVIAAGWKIAAAAVRNPVEILRYE